MIPFQLIGFSVLFGIVFLVALMSLWCDCCKCYVCCKCCCSRRAVYDRVILEQQEEVLKETFREAAKEQLTKRIFEKIDGNAADAQPAAQPPVQPPVQLPVQPPVQDQWIKDLRNIAAKMIEDSEKPVLSKEQKKKVECHTGGSTGTGEQQVEDD